MVSVLCSVGLSVTVNCNRHIASPEIKAQARTRALASLRKTDRKLQTSYAADPEIVDEWAERIALTDWYEQLTLHALQDQLIARALINNFQAVRRSVGDEEKAEYVFRSRIHLLPEFTEQLPDGMTLTQTEWLRFRLRFFGRHKPFVTLELLELLEEITALHYAVMRSMFEFQIALLSFVPVDVNFEPFLEMPDKDNLHRRALKVARKRWCASKAGPRRDYRA